MRYVGICALLLLGPWALAQKSVRQYPVFQTSGQSMWGGGSAPGLNMNFEIFPEYKVNLPFNTESFTKLRFSGLDFGAVLDGHVAFGVGPFEFDISGFTAGEIDVDYPAMVSLEVPDDNTFNPGETVVIRSGYQALPGAELRTRYPEAGSIGLYMGLMFDASFGFKACFIDCTPRISLLPPLGFPAPSPLYDERFTFFEVSPEGVTFVCNNQVNFPLEHPFQCSLNTGGPPWTISNGAFSGELDIPNVTTSSTLNGRNLSASGSDPYVIPSINVIELLGYIPPIKPATSVIQGSYTQDIAPDATGTMRGITIEWALASIDLNLPISQSQAFEFRPTIYTTLTFPDTVDYVVHSKRSGNIHGRGVNLEYEAGDSISVRFPCHYDFMDVYAQHRISNRFSNKTFDNIALELDFAAIDFGLTIDPYTIIPRVCIPIPFAKDICVGPVGFPGATIDPPPLYDPEPVTLVSQDFPPYFEDEWELGGFNVVDVPQPFRLQPRKRETLFALQHVACHGDSTGSIVTTVPNAAGPLKYEWSFGSTDPNPVEVAAGRHYVKITDANGCESIEAVEILEPPAIDLVLDADAITCTGGATEIEVTASGGTGALTYTWSTGETTAVVTDKSAGSYQVTATDALGCSTTQSITLADPAPLEIAIAEAIDPSCAGVPDGSIQLFVQGGSAPYQYAWSNGSSLRDQEFLEGGSYQVEVTDANGCAATDAITLVEPNVLTATLSKISDVSCFGSNDGALQVSVNGGTPPYQYRWYDSLVTLSETGLSIANLERGDYAVEITDARGCQVVRKTSVLQPGSPLHAVIEAIPGQCYDNSSGALDLTVQGGTPPYQFNWSSGQTAEDLFNIPAGTYSVTVTDAQGCVYSNKARLTDPPPIRVHLVRQDVTCVEQSDGQLAIASIEGGMPPYAIQWSTGESTEFIAGLSQGLYSVTVTDALGCHVTESREIRGNEADCLFIPNAFSPNGDGTNDVWNIRNLDLYPGAQVRVLNKWGMLVFESLHYNQPWDGAFNGKTLEPGTYYYIVDLNNGEAVHQGYLMILR